MKLKKRRQIQFQSRGIKERLGMSVVNPPELFRVDDFVIPEGSVCCVCGKPVSVNTWETGIVIGSKKGNVEFYHKKTPCPENNFKHVLEHPTLTNLLIYVDANKKNFQDVEMLREFKQTFYPEMIMLWNPEQVIKYITWEIAHFPPPFHISRGVPIGPRLIEEGVDEEDVEDIGIYLDGEKKKKKGSKLRRR